MGKRKVTPFLVATIITAGLTATGVHGFSNKPIKVRNQENVTCESRTTRSTKRRKDENSISHDSSENVNITKHTTDNIDPTVHKKEIPALEVTYPSGDLTVNGIKLSKQINNSTALYNKTQEIISNYSTDYQKAQAIYVWVSKNINYNKAEETNVMNNDFENTSAVKTFNTESGICEDFSTLYAVMAHDAGLSSRIIAGEGFGNNTWGDHAWNQVYIPSQGWINVDCTFANSYISLINKYQLPFNEIGLLSEQPYYTYITKNYSYKIYTEDYFNTSDFSKTHKNARIIAQINA